MTPLASIIATRRALNASKRIQTATSARPCPHYGAPVGWLNKGRA